MNVFFPTKTARVLALTFIFVLGIAIRLYDITDLPLEFHSTRQLLSLLKARGMYYQPRTDISPEVRAFAVSQWQVRASIEPEILERLTAKTYDLTDEQTWVPRAYSVAFWVIGAIFLYLLARRLSTPEGALTSAAIYLLLPYAIIASRSFQPDPLMTMLIVLFLWAVWEWSQTTSWAFAIMAGLFGGLAIFVKFTAAFFIIGAALGVVLGSKPWRQLFKDPQLYAMAGLGILPGAAYLVYGIWIQDYLGQQFGGRFMPSLFFSPSYYVGWLNMINLVLGGPVLMFALLGLFFFDDKKKQRLLLGLWSAYALFGLYFNFHIHTHDYYSLPLIPIAALSVAPLANTLLTKLAQVTHTRLLRLAAIAFILVGGVAGVWNTRNQLNAQNYRPQAAMWQEIANLTQEYTLAGLTQDYGSRMAYWGWQSITVWPTYGDLLYGQQRGGQTDFEKKFTAIAEKKDLFLITDFEELARQPFLKQKLQAYPIFAEGDGYVIYQLFP